jgi:nucleoid DNA-binding protein
MPNPLVRITVISAFFSMEGTNHMAKDSKDKSDKKAKAPTKGEVLNSIAEATGLPRKQVSAVIDAYTAEVYKSIGKKGPGVFQIPGICKVYVAVKKATPAKKGVKNPFTGEIRDVPAKPAKKVVKIRVLKQLKELVG